MVDPVDPGVPHSAALLAEKPGEHQGGQPGLFVRLAQDRLLRTFAVPNSAGGHLEAGVGVLRVAKDEQAVAVGNVGERLRATARIDPALLRRPPDRWSSSSARKQPVEGV